MRPIHFAAGHLHGDKVPMLNTLIDLGADIHAQALNKAWNPRENGFRKPIQLEGCYHPAAQATLVLAGADTSGLDEYQLKNINSAIRTLCVRQYARAMVAGMEQAGLQVRPGKKRPLRTLKQISALSPEKIIVPFFAFLPGLCKSVGSLLLRFYNRGIFVHTRSFPCSLQTTHRPLHLLRCRNSTPSSASRRHDRIHV